MRRRNSVPLFGHPRAACYFLFLMLGLLVACQPEANTLPDFTPLVKRNAPAVVNISTIQERAGGEQMDQLQGQVPELFRHFFEGFGERFQPPGPDAESMGSGFIVSKDGYILTNNHVIGTPEKILVRLQDRRELEARLVGHDERSDLALLKVEADNLPVVEIGSSKALEVGEWVLAIGAPFGFESSVTAGIVSAKGRSLPSENYVPFIQTDVAINPGNSGGPLFNLDGEVVGINSQIVSQSGGYMGLSFAIPIDMAMEIVEQIKEGGSVSRGWLGVLIQEVDYDLAKSFGLEKPMGALVAEVLPDSPAAQAGVQAGDVIVAFEGEEITVSSRLPHVVGATPAGSTAVLEIIRDGENISLEVEIGELPADAELGQSKSPGPEEAQQLGLVVRPLPDEMSKKLQLQQGVLVFRVEPGVAARAGIRKGDILIKLNGNVLDGVPAFRQAVEQLPETGVIPVLINRDGQARFIALKLEQ